MSADPGTAELVRAVGASDVDGVRRALAAGASPDAPDGAGRAFFAAIVSWATPEIVQLFVEAGARIPCEPDGAGWTFAHAAATRGDDALMAEVLRRGVALDARWEVSLMTPLETAAWYGHERCVALLLAAGASASAGAGLPSAHGRATMRGHAAIVVLLEAHGVHATVDESSPWPPRDWDECPRLGQVGALRDLARAELHHRSPSPRGHVDRACTVATVGSEAARARARAGDLAVASSPDARR